MNIIEDLEKRGLIDNYSNTENLMKLINSKCTIYCGFDPSFKSLQLGNFIMITILQRLQQAGHKVIAVLGGATGMIGDPSGRNSERAFLKEEQIKENEKCIKKQLEKYIETKDKKGYILNNYDWWKKVDTITFLREYGKNFQIGTMLAKDIVKNRLEVGISYAEFSYSILQSGDFLHLYDNYDCKIQLGGGDQWGNLTASLDYVKKKKGSDVDAEVCTVKLITDSQGKKFGKSEKGALYLDPNLTAPYSIYQYFVNVDDQSVKKYLYIFDRRKIEEIDKLYEKLMEKPEFRLAQKELAKVVVTLLHGEEVASKCISMSEALFKDSFDLLKKEELNQLTDGLVVLETKEEMNILDALVNLKLATSKREAREFVSNKAIKINGKSIDSLEYIVSKKDCLDGGYIFVKRGKKQYAVIKY